MKAIVSRFQRFRDVLRRTLGIWLFDKDKTTQFDLTKTASILFIRNDAKLGDAIVSSGLIRKLRKHRPDITIKVLTIPAMESLFKEHFGVDQVIHISKRPSYSEIRQVSEQVGQVDMVVSLNLDMKMKDIYLLNCLNSMVNVGVDQGVKLVNVNIAANIENQHYADKFDYVASLVGVNGPSENYIVPLLQNSIEKVNDFIQQNQIHDYVLLNPFGSGHSRKLNKSSISRIIETIEANDPSLNVVLLSSPDTRQQLTEMNLTSNKVYHFDKSASIYDAMAVINQAKFVVTVDTSIVHIATGLGIPQVAIYSDDKINYQNWHPNSGLSSILFTMKGINNFTSQKFLDCLNYLEIDFTEGIQG
ncbi:glycosyltransferase family 9 protein [Vibrio rhodolitus]|uniref:glycosyltransferase family 9 protein n=1 Tax=Vibrio rhodolitus TaxID=2231649 RepID=UPI000E0C1FA5|nr:glycosyltransferase family 9 protein [Vibrio rhodolitus]